jgi:hypothetical protein
MPITRGFARRGATERDPRLPPPAGPLDNAALVLARSWPKTSPASGSATDITTGETAGSSSVTRGTEMADDSDGTDGTDA